MISTARQAAYDVLRAVSDRRADLPSALAHVRARLPDERDRALAGEIVIGTLRWQGAFDHVIAAFTGRPIARLDREVLDALRLTAFQLLHLDRVPASAAVNDGVNLVRKAGKTSAAGLANAVLRRISRERARLPLPGRPADPADRGSALAYLSATLSHPEWLADRWLTRYGFDNAEAWARFDNEGATLTLRANRLRVPREELAALLAAEGVETEPTRFAPDGLTVRSGNPLLVPAASRGLFFVQDEASQLVGIATDVRPGERVLDACAAPGGKTTQMAAAMENRGLIVATDVRGRRVDLLARTVREAGATAARVVRADVAARLPFLPRFDCILLDAPCSGLGTLRRDPDIRWRRQPDHLEPMARLQSRMLEQASLVLGPGGRLVYATCSSEPEENEQVVAAFLAAHDEFSIQPGFAAGPLARFRTPEGHFRTLPHRDGLEAFFAAMLVKTKDLR